MVLTRLPGGLCSAHQPKAATRRNRALAAARDELVRAAVARTHHDASGCGVRMNVCATCRELRDIQAAAVAALAKLEAE